VRPQVKRAAVRVGALGALCLFGAGAATVFAGCAQGIESLHWAGAGFVVSGLVLWRLLARVDERSPVHRRRIGPDGEDVRQLHLRDVPSGPWVPNG
jgi:hypothetical protein